MAVTANLPQIPTRWLTVYRVWMTLVGALAAVAGAVMIFRPRSGGDMPAGLLAIALGIVLLSISIGLGLRRRWAWHVNYWGLVMALVGLALTILSSLPLSRTPQELVGPLLLALAVGLWCGLNLRYFRRRRSLFS